MIAAENGADPTEVMSSIIAHTTLSIACHLTNHYPIISIKMKSVPQIVLGETEKMQIGVILPTVVAIYSGTELPCTPPEFSGSHLWIETPLTVQPHGALQQQSARR